MTKPYNLYCINCGEVQKEKKTHTRCIKCDGSLDINYDYQSIKKSINKKAFKTSPINFDKYLSLLPTKTLNGNHTLGEGNTPLLKLKNIAKELNLSNLYAKVEGQNPTGSFKDRGSLLEIIKAKELGCNEIVLASTGNMGSSLALYCAHAKLKCTVVVPENTPDGKIAQITAAGAKLIRHTGNYSECARMAIKLADQKNIYLGGDYVYRQEGQKVSAWEMLQQLEWKVPDYIIVPIGNGTNASALAKGFLEAKKLGFIKNLPAIIGVQAKNVQPVVKAFEKGVKNNKIPEYNASPTIATAMDVSNPLDGIKLINYMSKLAESDMIAVSDQKMQEDQLYLAKTEGIYVESTSAATLSGLRKLMLKKKFKKSSRIVLILTGNGLKDSPEMKRR